MNLSFLRLGWRTLARDLRAGELRLLIVAVTLAVAALTSVGFFADRLQGGLQRDALQLLGGDAVVASDNPTPAAFVERAKSLGLQTGATVGFPTKGRGGTDWPGIHLQPEKGAGGPARPGRRRDRPHPHVGRGRGRGDPHGDARQQSGFQTHRFLLAAHFGRSFNASVTGG